MDGAGARILVVDDDARIRRLLSRYLAREGFQVDEAGDGGGMRLAMAQSPVDLVLLDLQLPGEDGLTLARAIREHHPGTPIIMLTGKAETVDKVVGLEVGADDYITKPFEERELLARVRAVLRRAAQAASPAPAGSRVLRFSRWQLDVEASEVRSQSGERVHLTNYEYRVLATLVNRPNRVFSRDELLDAVTDRAWTPYDRSIDVLIGKLRKKLEEDPQHPSLIKSVRGQGYKFAAKVTR